MKRKDVRSLLPRASNAFIRKNTVACKPSQKNQKSAQCCKAVKDRKTPKKTPNAKMQMLMQTQSIHDSGVSSLSIKTRISQFVLCVEKEWSWLAMSMRHSSCS